MIIDGVEYPDTSKKPKVDISIKNFNLMIRMLSLMSLSIQPAIAKPLALLRSAQENIIYNNVFDPDMPTPSYYNGEGFNFPFTGHNSSNALVLAGDHTVTYTYTGGGGIFNTNVSISTSASCFDYDELVKVLQESVGNISSTTLVNYTSPYCQINNNYYESRSYKYNALVYGMTESDCALFRNKYNARVDYCNREDLMLLWIFLGMLGSCILSCLGVALSYRYRATIRTSLTAYLTGSSVNSPDNETTIWSEIPGITPELKQYLIEIEGSGFRPKKLSQTDSALIEEDESLCCPMSHVLMDMPVILGTNIFEFSYLASCSEQPNGSRRHPFRVLDVDNYYLKDLKPATETRKTIENLIKEKLAPVSEGTALLPRPITAKIN